MLNAGAATRYVDAQNSGAAPPYLSWSTAATNIQDAIDAASAGDLVLVTNGIYGSGARYCSGSNRVTITKAVVVRSVNGPELTVIEGSQHPGTTNGLTAIRCAFVTNGAMLAGFTLTNGATVSTGIGGGVLAQAPSWQGVGVVSNCLVIGNSAGSQGGGAYNGVFLDCRLVGNSAESAGGAVYAALTNCSLEGNVAVVDGGGAQESTLSRCTLRNNRAGKLGGGAHTSMLERCLLDSNYAGVGGGSYSGRLDNCVLTQNKASLGGGSVNGAFTNCTITANSCTSGDAGVSGGFFDKCIIYYNAGPNGEESPGWSRRFERCCLPGDYGLGSFTNAPRFVYLAGGNLRLAADSPCINAGGEAHSGFDMDGNPRVVNGLADVGAYEYQGPGSILPYFWLQRFGFAVDGSADHLDTDGDGHTTWQEWRCGTLPTDYGSALRMLSAVPAGTDVRVEWTSVYGVRYRIEWSPGVGASPGFALVTNLLGSSKSSSFLHRNAAGHPQGIYRVAAE